MVSKAVYKNDRYTRNMKEKDKKCQIKKPKKHDESKSHLDYPTQHTKSVQ